MHLDRMPFGMNSKTLGPGQCHLHRLAGHPGHQGRLGLDRQIFLATERPSVGHQLHLHPLRRDPQHRGNLPLIVKDPLPLRVDMQAVLPFRRPGDGQARLRFQKEVFNMLRVVGVLQKIGRLGERFLHIAPLLLRLAEQVGPAPGMH